MFCNCKNVVFAGAGLKGFAYIGQLKAIYDLFHVDLTQSCAVAAGTSAGAMIAMLIAVGYSLNEICDIITKFQIQDFVSWDLTSLFYRHGIDDGKMLRDLYASYVDMKLGKGVGRTLTLSQVFAATGRHFMCCATDIVSKQPMYLSTYDTSCFGDMLLINAVYSSMCVPLIFAPLKYKNHILIDGGVTDNFPIKQFPASETIGFQANHLEQNRTATEYLNASSLLDFVTRVFHISITDAVAQQTKTDHYNILSVEIDAPIFSLDPDFSATTIANSAYVQTQNLIIAHILAGLLLYLLIAKHFL